MVLDKQQREQQLAHFSLPAVMPQHIAIIMDGNGRWAQQKHLPRIAGHRAGVQTVRDVASACAHWQIPALTLFAFSSENWERPRQEVDFLMGLFQSTLNSEIEQLHGNQIRLRIIGDKEVLPTEIQKSIEQAEALTKNNTGLNLSIALNYGGYWDITQAVQQLAQKVQQGTLTPDAIKADDLEKYLMLHELPSVDLFIRTSGELRISNFMLWQLAYAELYFTQTLWPDFNDQALYEAICEFAQRERRYGTLSDKTTAVTHA